MSKCAVIVSRNDNYGGNLVHRARHCINVLSKTFDHVVYVDWKTVLGMPLTSEFECPSNVTTICVTKGMIQEKWPQWEHIPVIETIGRNIGIRKAIDMGFDWICSTNIDVLIEPFDTDKLDKDTLYTARRRNMPEQAHLPCTDSKKLLEDAIELRHIYEIAPIAVVNGVGVWDPGDHWSLAVCCGDFQLAHQQLWLDIRGFEEEMVGRCYADSNLMKRPILIGKSAAILDVNVFHLNHGSSSNRAPGESLPINDQQKYVANWEKSTNKKTWGQL